MVVLDSKRMKKIFTFFFLGPDVLPAAYGRTVYPLFDVALVVRCGIQISTPTAPPGPLPTLLGARESNETTLPLLNKVILQSFAHSTDNVRPALNQKVKSGH